MKKIRCLALLLSCLLAVQCFFLPASAQMETTETLETLPTESADMTAQTADIPFGQVCIQKGCRTINSMSPLAGSERKLDTALSAFLYETTTDTVVYAYNPDRHGSDRHRKLQHGRCGHGYGRHSVLCAHGR